MLFNSITFLVFFVIVFVIYWLLRNRLRWQNLFLLISSYFFYGWWDWRFLFLLFANSLVNFLIAQEIGKTEDARKRKVLLNISLVFNLGVLGVFKYFNFFVDSFAGLFDLFGMQLGDSTINIVLPVGISFYTFQALSYVIDVYRRDIRPVDDPVSFFAFKALFPQLVAGPIERASNMLVQIEKPRVFNQNWFNAGLFQVAVGFFRKIVIADSLAVYVDTVYGNPEYYNSNTLILATVLYAFQIYYDFAGYSDIAIGTGKMLGFKFHRNFDLPYFSKSLTEFWRKWHMSLSYWLRDYLYISLGGNRKGIRITYRNLMLTMLLGGLWHGSSWNFVIWGGIHGLVLCLEKYFKSRGLTLGGTKFAFLGYISTFLVVCFAWIFFRAQSFADAKTIIAGMFNYSFALPYLGDVNVLFSGVLVLCIGLLVDLSLRIKNIPLEERAESWSIWKTSIVTAVFIVAISLFYSSANNFIYFQF